MWLLLVVRHGIYGDRQQLRQPLVGCPVSIQPLLQLPSQLQQPALHSLQAVQGFVAPKGFAAAAALGQEPLLHLLIIYAVGQPVQPGSRLLPHSCLQAWQWDRRQLPYCSYPQAAHDLLPKLATQLAQLGDG